MALSQRAGRLSAVLALALTGLLTATPAWAADDETPEGAAAPSARPIGSDREAPDTLPESLPAAKVVVIDIQEVLAASTAAAGLRQERAKKFQGYQKEIAGQEKDLQKAEQELQRQRTILAPEAFAKRQEAFQKKVAEFQQEVQIRRQALESAFGQGMAKVQRELVQVSGTLTEEVGANLVLPKSQILLFDPGVDLTRVVSKELNTRLPEVAFPEVDLDAVRKAQKEALERARKRMEEAQAQAKDKAN